MGAQALPCGLNTLPPAMVAVTGVDVNGQRGWKGLHSSPCGIPNTEKGTPGRPSVPNDSMTSEPSYCWFSACEVAAHPSAIAAAERATERRIANMDSPSRRGRPQHPSSAQARGSVKSCGPPRDRAPGKPGPGTAPARKPLELPDLSNLGVRVPEVLARRAEVPVDVLGGPELVEALLAELAAAAGHAHAAEGPGVVVGERVV